MVPWQIQLFGTFGLIDSEGRKIVLASRKLEALLATLVVSHPYGLSREEICTIVWPDTESKQSLRQALYALKKTLGADAIEATMDRCRISETFSFNCDYHDEELRKSDVFMPSCDGDWFDRLRSNGAAFEASEPGESATHGFVSTLSWFAQHDPIGFYRVLNSSPNLTRGLPFQTLKQMSDRAFEASGEFRGWALYWRASAEENLLRVEIDLQQALKEAQRLRDAELASEVTLELGKALVRLGKPDQAMKVSAIADALAEQESKNSLTANSLRLRGTILTYYGQEKSGVALMRKAENLAQDVLGQAISESVRALYLASFGATDEARAALEGPINLNRGLGHRRIFDLQEVTTAIIDANEGTYEDAVPMLEKILLDSKKTGFTQFGVCASDLLAKIHLNVGESMKAKAYSLASKEGRALSQAVKTPYEVRRQALVAK